MPPSKVGAEADRERDARAVDDAAEHVAAHEIGAQQMAAAGRASETRELVEVGSIRRDEVGEYRREHEHQHDHRADRAQRIARRREERAAAAAGR